MAQSKFGIWLLLIMLGHLKLIPLNILPQRHNQVFLLSYIILQRVEVPLRIIQISLLQRVQLLYLVILIL